MSLKKYEAFVRTVDLGSLTKAAQDLGSTQSRISHILSDLESEYGFCLMRRSRGGIELTEAGRLLLPKMREILHREQELSECIQEIRNANAGTVRIGVFTSVAVHWLPGMIRSFQAEHPGAKLEMRSGDYHDVDQWLREGTVDLGLMIDPGTEDLTFLPLLEDCYSVILPREHPLAGAEELSLEQLREECFILLEPEDNAPVEPQLRQAGVRVGYRVKDDYTILAMVESGLGVSVLPHLLLQRTSYRVHAARLMPPVARRMGILLPKEGYVSLAARQFVSFLRQEAEAVEK